MLTRKFVFAFALAAISSGVQAQNMDHGGTHVMPQMQADPIAIPSEPGQGAFASIAEIVGILTNASNTDWDKVDITALRDHLLDMDRLVTEAQVREEEIAHGLKITISIAGEGGVAAQRMVPAHAPVLAEETGWLSNVVERDGQLEWSVTSFGESRQIKALGFYGLMATGAHHNTHHMAIATGRSAH